MFRLICVLIGYALGNFLTAEAVVKKKTGKSVFEIGSHNPGMANVMAQCGFEAGILVLAGDLAKTVLACVLCRFVLFPQAGIQAAAWAGLGHDFPCWHRFRGGKGVSCTCAAIFCVDPIWGLLAMIVGMIIVFATQYLPVGAIFIPAAFILFSYLLFRGVVPGSAAAAGALFPGISLPGGTAPIGGSVGTEVALVSFLMTILMLYCHFPGLRGVAAGTEKKVNVTGLLKKKFGRLTVVIALAASLLLLLAGLAPWYRSYMRREDIETCRKARLAVCLDYQDAQDALAADGVQMTEEKALAIVQKSLAEHFDASMAEFGDPVPDICRSGDGTWTITYNPETRTICTYCTAQDHEEVGSQ